MLTEIEHPKTPDAAYEMLKQWRREGLDTDCPDDAANLFEMETGPVRKLIHSVAPEDYDLTNPDEAEALWSAATTLRVEGEKLVLAIRRHHALEAAEKLIGLDECRRILREEA